MYADMQVLVHESAGIGIPVFISILDAPHRQLKGLRPIPIGGLMGYNFAETSGSTPDRRRATGSHGRSGDGCSHGELGHRRA